MRMRASSWRASGACGLPDSTPSATAADHAASAFPIYDLNRTQAYGMQGEIKVALKNTGQEPDERK